MIPIWANRSNFLADLPIVETVTKPLIVWLAALVFTPHSTLSNNRQISKPNAIELFSQFYYFTCIKNQISYLDRI